MSIMLFNPTNEVLEMQFAGITKRIISGERVKVSDAEGNHLLNSMGGRGLTQLEYGCDEEKVTKDAINRNIEFKKKQISEYNQRNESRKQMGMGYLPPTEYIKKCALELGIGLLEPYTMKDTEKSEISRLLTENNELKVQMAQLLNKVNLLINDKEEPKQRGNPNWTKKKDGE